MTDLFPIEPSEPSPMEKARRKLKELEHEWNAALIDRTPDAEIDLIARALERQERIVRAMEAARLAR